MPLASLVVPLIIAGVTSWLVNRFTPMGSSVKTVLNVVIVVFMCGWLLQTTGLWAQISSLHIKR